METFESDTEEEDSMKVLEEIREDQEISFESALEEKEVKNLFN